MIRWLAAAVLVVALGVGGWFGYRAFTVSKTPVAAITVEQEVPEGAPSDIETLDTGATQAAVAGATPMAERVAVVGLLNKRNGESREVTLKPGHAVRYGDVVVRLRACDRTAPWEVEQLTGAFVQMDVRGPDKAWRRSFSGWLFKERPALNVVQHPVYDVWTKSCTMSFPATGPDAETLSAPTRSSRPKSPEASTPDAEGEPATTPANASANSAI